MTALKAMTIWPAYQHFEEDRKGSIWNPASWPTW
jgi:predicted amidohydrolase YtcJ